MVFSFAVAVADAMTMSEEEASKGFHVVGKQKCYWNTMTKTIEHCRVKRSRWRSSVAAVDSDTAVALLSVGYDDDGGGARVDDCANVDLQSEAVVGVMVAAACCFVLEQDQNPTRRSGLNSAAAAAMCGRKRLPLQW